MINERRFLCPVCGYPDLNEPPYDAQGCASYDICPSCGTEFGYDDATRSHAELRQAWIAAGAPWNSRSIRPPERWDAREQVRQAKLPVSFDKPR